MLNLNSPILSDNSSTFSSTHFLYFYTSLDVALDVALDFGPTQDIIPLAKKLKVCTGAFVVFRIDTILPDFLPSFLLFHSTVNSFFEMKKQCGVFGVSSDEYLNYAEKNRKEWEARGQEVVAGMVEKYRDTFSEARIISRVKMEDTGFSVETFNV